MPLALAQDFGMDAQGLATIASVGSLLGVGFIFLAGWLSDKLGTRKWVALGFIAATLVVTLGLNAASVLVFSICAVAYSAIGSGPVNGVLNAAFPEVHPHRNVASAYALSATIGGITAFLLAYVLGALAEQTGAFTAGWVLLAAFTALAGLLIWRVKVR